MNFQNLIHQRETLLRQARLANLAYACQRLEGLAARIARARLHGRVELRPGDPASMRPWPMLLALSGSQAVLDEHFLEEEIVELADILSFLGQDLPADGLRFRLEELDSWLLPVLQRELAAAGVNLPQRNSAGDDAERQPGAGAA